MNNTLLHLTTILLVKFQIYQGDCNNQVVVVSDANSLDVTRKIC